MTVGVSDVRVLLRTRWEQCKTSEVSFREVLEPAIDPYARFTVAYEGIIEPASLTQIRLEIWVTTDGQVAIGVETKARVAERLRVRNQGTGFAAGHEPSPMSTQVLRELIELSAHGEINIGARIVPWLGMVKTSAVVAPGTKARLTSTGYRVDWLGEVRATSIFLRVLPYDPW